MNVEYTILCAYVQYIDNGSEIGLLDNEVAMLETELEAIVEAYNSTNVFMHFSISDESIYCRCEFSGLRGLCCTLTATFKEEG